MNIWADANGWPVPPMVLLGCLAAEILYYRGWHVLEREERAKKAARALSASTLIGSFAAKYTWDSWLWRGIYFLIAIMVALIGDSAPVDLFSGRLFWVHMVQHLLLLVVIAPLIVASAPLLPLWYGLPDWARKLLRASARLKAGKALNQIGHWLRHPVASYVLLIAGIWIWHWPPLYDLALTDETIHDWCEHLTFIAVSVLFWTQVIPSPPLYPRLGYIGRMGCVGAAIVQNIVLAVLLGFSQVALYAPYAHLVTVPGSFTALQDQQLGAGIMWTFGDVPFMIAIGVLMQSWLATQSDSDQTAPQHEAVSAGAKERVGS